MVTRVRVYLDHNATAPLHPEVRDAMVRALAAGAGNPSSIHAEGRAGRDLVEAARREVAALVGGRPEEIVFTSGGTEADALAVIGLARAAVAAGRPAVVAAAAVEHPAVGGAVAELVDRGFEARALPVDREGRVQAVELDAAVVAIALANHELGTVHDVAAIATAARARGARVVCDAVQAAGKLALDVRALGVDALAISAHKLGGPAGVGALWVRDGVDVPPLVGAGHHERGRRPGTENVLGIVGFGVAAARARTDGLAAQPRIAALRDRLERALLAIPGARVHGAGAPRVATTTNVAFEGAPGDAVVQALDLEGIAASTGAACTSGRIEPSRVLLALGLSPDRAAEAVRFSLGPSTTEADIDHVIDLVPGLIDRVRHWCQAP